MAIAFDAYGEGSAVPASSITYSHTTTGTNRGLVAFVGDMGGARCTGVTYNSVAMTQADLVNFATSRNIYCFKLAAPASGANNVVASFSASDFYSCQTQSYTDVDQTDFEDTSGIQTGTGNITISVTTTADNCWLASAGSNTDVGPMSAGTGTTSRGTEVSVASGDSAGAKTPAGSHSMQWTAASGTSGGVMIAIKPAGGGGGATSRTSLLTLGVG